MSDLHAAITARIDALQRIAEAASHGSERISLTWPRTAGKDSLMAFINTFGAQLVLRGLAEDRDILARHEFYYGPGKLVCAQCGWNPVDPRPCPDQLSLLRRHGIEVAS